ncbi:NAD-dependent epimerase/dehydratase family protein [Marimonas lutisalis]|uniref:NAD-dependent epimerase/dehydratase family protein n=1 Tax=Marimonas lutisalis TaxID=2545756 RepID=UPI0010F663A8|nr:NAD-dependent epimerase/dehydratase family protein [Marimonas lutisalis]
MFCILGASGFIGRSMAEAMQDRAMPYRALVRNKAELPGDLFAGAESVHDFDFEGGMDMRVFDGISTVLVASWATKPNTPNNTLVSELRENVVAHSRFLTALKKTGVKHLMFLSSGGAVYGAVDQSEKITEAQLCVPCTPYGYGKLCIEKAIQGFWGSDGRRYTILRPSNPVGRHQMLSVGVHGLFPSVIHALIRGEPVNVFGDGTTVRDYFAVEDLADLVLAADARDAGNQIVNASSGTGLSINQVIALCAEATGRTPQLRPLPDKQPEIAYNVLSNDRARRIFDWAPTRSIEDVARGLVRALETGGNGA